jgi:hypothetical protein
MSAFPLSSLRLNRRLGRRISVRLRRPLNRRPDGRAVRPKNQLREICGLLERYVRMRKRATRRDPHLFGRHAQQYYQDTVRMEQEQLVRQAALDRVYGPDPAAASMSAARHSVWVDRYFIRPKNQRLFRKWFRETYGS